MKEYPHIDSVFKRDEKGKFLFGEYSKPEFEYLKDLPWTWTEKIDGTNIRVKWFAPGESDGAVEFGGKTDNAQIPTKLFKVLQELFPTEKFSQLDLPDLCLYGEGYGAGIQKGGGLYSPEQKFILFDVKIGNWWLLRKDVEDIADKLGLDIVPIVSDYSIMECIEVIYQMATNSDTHDVTGIGNRKAPIEGYVGQPEIPLFTRKGERIITKVKVKDFR